MSTTKIKSENSAVSTENTTPREEDDDICELEHLRKLFIGGLAPYTTEESLKDFYSQFGKVVDVVVMRDPTSKRSRGFGFITYTKSCMVDKAQENRPHVVDGKTVEAKRALPRPERESRESNLSVKKLFVGGLKDNHDEQCLEDYFTQFGKVVSVKILTDKTTGKRRGFAFIEFDDYDSVDKAILQKQHSIKYVLVDVKKSVYKHENRNNNNLNNIGKQQQGNKVGINGQNGYRGPMPPAPAIGQYPQQPPMNGGPPPPPANYNYWGPPPPMQPPYGGYQPPPPQPQMNAWNYPPAAQPWNAGPPPGGPSWYPPNQWGGPPPSGGVPPPPVAPVIPGVPPSAPAANWAAPPQVQPVQAPPAVPGSNVPTPAQQQVQQPTQQPQQQPNFGNGYQQSYGGGPTKNNMHANRMNPYNQPSSNNYVTNGQSGGAGGYGGYNAGGPNAKTGAVGNSSGSAPGNNAVAIAAGGGNKYRR